MNKKTILGIVIACIAVIIVGVVYFISNDSNLSDENNVVDQTTNKVDKNSKTLVVYFSQPETDKIDNMTEDEENSTVVVDGKVFGNTEYVANLISEKINADLFRLEPVNAYPTDHEKLLDRAREEMQNDERPEIKNPIDISDYETIFIGYPIWNSDLPPIINIFLENNDFDGKTVIPFCSHGGSGLARTPSTIADKLSNANVITNNFEIYRDDMDESKEKVDTWLSEIGY